MIYGKFRIYGVVIWIWESLFVTQSIHFLIASWIFLLSFLIYGFEFYSVGVRMQVILWVSQLDCKDVIMIFVLQLKDLPINKL